MSKKSMNASILCLVLMLAVNYVYGLTVLPLTDEQMAAKSEIIVVGTVLSAYYETNTVDKHPFTNIRIRVNEYLKGKNRLRELTLKTPGGIGNKIGMVVPGAADFHRNEEVLLFLERRNDGSLLPVGLVLGKYSIYRDQDTGKKVAVRHGDGQGKYLTEPRETVIRDLQPEQKIFLDDFRQKIRQFVER